MLGLGAWSICQGFSTGTTYAVLTLLTVKCLNSLTDWLEALRKKGPDLVIKPLHKNFHHALHSGSVGKPGRTGDE